MKQSQRNKERRGFTNVGGAIITVLLIPAAIYAGIALRNAREVVIDDSFIENPVAGDDKFIPDKNDLDFSYDGPTDLRRYDVYGVRSQNLPSIGRIYFNPLDAWVGEEQSIVVQVRNAEPVESVWAQVVTDNESNTYNFEIVGGEPNDSYWSGSWMVEDTHESRYEVTVWAKSGEDESHITLSF